MHMFVRTSPEYIPPQWTRVQKPVQFPTHAHKHRNVSAWMAIRSGRVLEVMHHYYMEDDRAIDDDFDDGLDHKNASYTAAGAKSFISYNS